jgi:hypothetical protein
VTSGVRIGSSTNSSRWPPKILGNDSLLGELLFRSEPCNTAALHTRRTSGFGPCDAESPGRQEIIVETDTSDERASEGSHPAYKVASPTVAATVSNATVAWSTLGIHKQPAKSATFKPTEKPTCKTSRQIFLSLGRTESNTTRGNVSDGSATGER